MSGGVSILDYSVVAAFFAAMVCVGVWYSGRAGTADELMEILQKLMK